MEDVDRALQSLAAQDSLELPDPRLAQRLQRAARLGQDRGWRPRLHSIVAGCALLLGLTGVAIGATVGLDGLKAWWYHIVIDGEERSGTMEDDGTQHVEYTSPDGVRVTVKVEHQALPGLGSRTSVAVREESADGVEEEEFESVLGEDTAQEERFARQVLEQAQALHTWTAADGTRNSLWLDSDPDADGSRLLLEELDSQRERPVRLVLRTARRITGGGMVQIEELPGGVLEVEIDDGHGWAIAVVLGGVPAPEQEFTTPSGRVRVNVGD